MRGVEGGEGGQSTPSEDICVEPHDDALSGPREFDISTPPRGMPSVTVYAPGLLRGRSLGDPTEGRQIESRSPAPALLEPYQCTYRRMPVPCYRRG